MSQRVWAGLCAGLLVASSASAAITPDAQRVVTRWLEATGGVATFAAESTGYLRARVEAFGFTGRFESWTARPSRRLARTELGPFKLSEGTEGTTAWRTDPTTGVVRPLADHDLREALESTWFELDRWAEPDQGGGAVAFIGADRDGADAVSVLEVTPPAFPGETTPPHARRLLFRDRDGLLVRTIERDDQREVVTAYTEHVRLAGRLRPRVSETTLASMPANRMRSIADSVVANPSVAAVRFAAPLAEGAGEVGWLLERGVARLPFEYRARHVWVKARVNGGPPQDFLFDTGASVTVLDSAWVAQHGLRTSGRMQAAGELWSIGILNPYNNQEVVEVVHLGDGAIATSGLYERGAHVRDPRTGEMRVSLDSATVVGPDAGLADALATGCLVEGLDCIQWFSGLPGWSVYLIHDGRAAFYGPAFPRSMTPSDQSGDPHE